MAEKVALVIIKHAQFMDHLYERPLYKRGLAEELDVSKSTIYNTHKKLEKYGLVTKRNGKYTLTKEGKIAIEIYYRYKNKINQLDISNKKNYS